MKPAPTQNPQSPNFEFWQQFLANHWEQKPFFGQWDSGITEEYLFEGMLAAADFELAQEQSNFCDPFRVSLDGTHVLDFETLCAFLPAAQDCNFDGYSQRIQEQWGGDLGIQISKISRFSPAIWQRVRRFLAPFFDQAGLVPETIEIDLFFGQYQQTHFGVHRDADSTFTFGIQGEKTFRMWPFETFSPEMAVEGWPAHIQDRYYEKFRNKGQTVPVRPGTLLYWPSSVWHVGESPNSWSVTLAVALTLKPDPYERIKAIISSLLPDPVQVVNPNFYRCDIPARKQTTPELAPALAEALADICAAMANPTLDQHICLDWLKQVSGCGLTATSPPAEIDLNTLEPLKINPTFPIHWKVFEPNTLVLAANGYGAIFQVENGLDFLISAFQTWNQGQILPLAHFLENSAPESQTQIHAILDTLASWYLFSP
ncbi:MAG: hypothetical protein H6510_12050 [Acidobacteria bacterium]|nr:hypothetical protein [Acidobacteriota bacterium]MCB9398539.1 hypothetical protein [Acidobacteriota bacterium]